jgi:AraC-like DNA-binding protein
MNKKRQTINVVDFSDRYAEDGIIIVDNVAERLLFGEAYLTSDYAYSICHKGHVNAEYDTHPIRYNPHDVAILYPKHLILANNASNDYKVTLVVVSEKKFEERYGRFSFLNIRHELDPGFHLSESQYVDVMRVIDTMRVVSHSTMSGRSDLLDNLMEVLLRLTDHYRSLSGLEPIFSPQKLSARYIEAVIEHHRKEHSVTFYANELCLSPKYFSNVIKMETGKSAKYWITYYIIVEAKFLLRTRKDMNIQEISDYLGFEDQTSFSRTFKNFLGVTPTEYRSSLKE